MNYQDKPKLKGSLQNKLTCSLQNFKAIKVKERLRKLPH